MNNIFGSVVDRLNVYQATVKSFCEDFNINFKKYYIGIFPTSRSTLAEDFISFLIKNQDFIREYHRDYYSDKTPEIIARTVSRDINQIHAYLKQKYPQHYKNDEFIVEQNYPLRYVSSYKIDYELYQSQYEAVDNYLNWKRI